MIHTVPSALSLCFMIVDQDDLAAMPFLHHYKFCSSETVTPIEHFLLLVVLVMVFYQSNRIVTNTPSKFHLRKEMGVDLGPNWSQGAWTVPRTSG